MIIVLVWQFPRKAWHSLLLAVYDGAAGRPSPPQHLNDEVFVRILSEFQLDAQKMQR